MEGMGTNTGSIFAALECLNGASLNKVYASFGARPYSTLLGSDDMRDLFGWFAGELEYGWSGWYYNDCVPTCTAFVDNCGELDYMRAIWVKSSIPVTF